MHMHMYVLLDSDVCVPVNFQLVHLYTTDIFLYSFSALFPLFAPSSSFSLHIIYCSFLRKFFPSLSLNERIFSVETELDIGFSEHRNEL